MESSDLTELALLKTHSCSSELHTCAMGPPCRLEMRNPFLSGFRDVRRWQFDPALMGFGERRPGQVFGPTDLNFNPGSVTRWISRAHFSLQYYDQIHKTIFLFLSVSQFLSHFQAGRHVFRCICLEYFFCSLLAELVPLAL